MGTVAGTDDRVAPTPETAGSNGAWPPFAIAGAMRLHADRNVSDCRKCFSRAGVIVVSLPGPSPGQWPERTQSVYTSCAERILVTPPHRLGALGGLTMRKLHAGGVRGSEACCRRKWVEVEVREGVCRRQDVGDGGCTAPALPRGARETARRCWNPQSDRGTPGKGRWARLRSGLVRRRPRSQVLGRRWPSAFVGEDLPEDRVSIDSLATAFAALRRARCISLAGGRLRFGGSAPDT